MFTNPYPDGPAELSSVRYLTALLLIRPQAQLLERLGEDGDYILARDYDVEVVVDGEPRTITAPRGLITDLTSVPWWLRWFVGRVGPWLEAAIIHDWLYVAWRVVGHIPTETDRAFADRVMLLAMEAAGVKPVRRQAIYLAVRTFGGRPFLSEARPVFADLDDEAYDVPMIVPRV
ncbi:DUF1353 domain-containing protein [Palleronia sp.]|uniref:DUF1353 domain-containing protein n=1 Tax=Palleronia sp. TaxID=1940284 RepID=UPI0035C81C21